MSRAAALKPKKTVFNGTAYREYFVQDERDFAVACQNKMAHQIYRESIVTNALVNLVAVHLEFYSSPNIRDETCRGADHALEYFYGSWWQDDDQDRACLDKSLPLAQRRLIWMSPYLMGVFLCASVDRWEAVQELSDWVDESVTPEFQFEVNDDGFSFLLIYLASKLRKQPLTKEHNIEEFIRSSKSKKSKLLLDVIDSALTRSQKDFDKSLVASLKHWEKTGIQDCPNLRYWIALPQSMIWLIAERNGLSFPALPANLDAMVVRKQTVFQDVA